MEASSPIPGKAHRCTWAKHAAGSSSSGAPPLPSAASPFAGRAPGTPTSASWPPRRVLGRIPSKSLPFSCSLAVPRARKGGLQAGRSHQKALALKISRGSQSRLPNFCFSRLQVRPLINFRADTFWAGHRCFAPPDGPARSFRARSARGQIGDFVTVSWIWAGKSNPKRDTLEDIEARPTCTVFARH